MYFWCHFLVDVRAVPEDVFGLHSPGRLLTSLDRRSLAFQVQTLFTMDVGCGLVEYSRIRNGWYNTIWRLQCWYATGSWVKSSPGRLQVGQLLLSHLYLYRAFALGCEYPTLHARKAPNQAPSHFVMTIYVVTTHHLLFSLGQRPKSPNAPPQLQCHFASRYGSLASMADSIW